MPTIQIIIEGASLEVPAGISIAAALALTADPTTPGVPGDRQRPSGAGLPDAVPAGNEH